MPLAVWNIQNCVQDGGHFNAETNMAKVFGLSIFHGSCKLEDIFKQSANANLS